MIPFPFPFHLCSILWFFVYLVVEKYGQGIWWPGGHLSLYILSFFTMKISAGNKRKWSWWFQVVRAMVIDTYAPPSVGQKHWKWLLLSGQSYNCFFSFESDVKWCVILLPCNTNFMLKWFRYYKISLLKILTKWNDTWGTSDFRLQTSFRSYFMRSDFSNSAFIFRQSISFNEIRVTWLSTYSPIWSDTPWCSTSRHVFLSSVVEASKKETLKDVQQIWEMNNLKVFTF